MSNSDFEKAVSTGITIAGLASGLLGRAAGESNLTDQLQDSYSNSQDSQREQNQQSMDAGTNSQNQSHTSGSK